MNNAEILLVDAMSDLALACFVKCSEAGMPFPIGDIKPIAGLKPIQSPSWYMRLQRNQQKKVSDWNKVRKATMEQAKKPNRNVSAEVFASNHGIPPALLYSDQGAAFDKLTEYLARNHAKSD